MRPTINLKLYRILSNLSQPQLGALLTPFVDAPTISKWEKGVNPIPARYFADLQKIFQAPIAKLTSAPKPILTQNKTQDYEDFIFCFNCVLTKMEELEEKIDRMEKLLLEGTSHVK